ncbi:MAG: zf-HC2 domain-containing protein, partial [Pirellulaceae bacterium]
MTGEAIPELDEELLSAYLDGELSDEQRREFQARLASEPILRERLVTYQQAWDLLDQYPETPQKPSFTKSTLEMAAVGVVKETPAKSYPVSREGRRLKLPSWALWLVASSILGSLAGLAFRWQRMQSDLERLLPAAHLPSLRFIQDLPEAEKLLTMPELEWFAEHVDGVSERILPAIPSRLPARSDWVQQLSLTHQSILWRRVRELEKLSDAEQLEVTSAAKKLDTS